MPKIEVAIPHHFELFDMLARLNPRERKISWKRAVNASGKAMKVMAAKEVARKTTMKSTKAKKAMTTGRLGRTGTELGVYFRAKTEPMEIGSDFARAFKAKGYQKRGSAFNDRYVEIEIYKGRRRRAPQPWFVAKMESGHRAPFFRAGKERLPIYAAKTTSPGVVIASNRDLRRKIARRGGKVLIREFMGQLKLITDRKIITRAHMVGFGKA